MIQPQKITTYSGHAERGTVQSLSVLPGGNEVRTAGTDGTARLWNLFGGELRCPHQFHGTYRVCLSPDGRHLLSSDPTGPVWVWTLIDYRQPDVPEIGLFTKYCQIKTVRMLKTPGWVYSLGFSSDNRLVAVGLEGGVTTVWRTFQKKQEPLFQTEPLSGHTPACKAVAFLDDDRIVASASWSINDDLTIELLEPHSGGALQRIEGPSGWAVESGAFDHTGRWAAFSGRQGGLIVWDLGTGSEPIEMATRSPVLTVLCFSEDGRRFAAGDQSGTIRIWQLPGWQIIAEWQAHQRGIRALHLSMETPFVFSTAGGREVYVWDPSTNEDRPSDYPIQTIHPGDS